MSSTFGAPFGGTTRGGHQLVDSLALSLITPPNAGGSGGSCVPLIDVVALGEPLSLVCCAVPDVPVVCWVDGGALRRSRASFRPDEQPTANNAATTLAVAPVRRTRVIVVFGVFIGAHPFGGQKQASIRAAERI
jgi:hypothetical protein